MKDPEHKEALEKAHRIAGCENLKAEDLRHDEDALDTWFLPKYGPLGASHHLEDSWKCKFLGPTQNLNQKL